jgi:hypothetical protein
MADKLSDGPRLNWEAIAKFADLGDVLDAIPPAEIIRRLGDPSLLKQVGVGKILAAVGEPEGFDAKETEALCKGLMARFTPEQIQEMVRQEIKE